jgi:hypothetical protein
MLAPLQVLPGPVFTGLDGISLIEEDRPVHLSTTATIIVARFRQIKGRKYITLPFSTDFDRGLS